MKTYYEGQLNQLLDSVSFKSLKVYDGVRYSTQYMNLNSESIPVLIAFLKKEQKRLKFKEQLAEKSNGGNET